MICYRFALLCLIFVVDRAKGKHAVEALCRSDRTCVVATSSKWLELIGAVMDFENAEIEYALKKVKGAVKLENAICMRRVLNSAIPAIVMSDRKCAEIIQHEYTILSDNRIHDSRYKDEHRKILVEMFETQPKMGLFLNFDTTVLLLNYAKVSLSSRATFTVEVSLKLLRVLCRVLMRDSISDAGGPLLGLFLDWFAVLSERAVASFNEGGSSGSDSGNSLQILACVCDCLASLLNKQAIECLHAEVDCKLRSMLSATLHLVGRLGVRENAREAITRFFMAYSDLRSNTVAGRARVLSSVAGVASVQFWEESLLGENNLRALVLFAYTVFVQQHSLSSVCSAGTNNSVSGAPGLVSVAQYVSDAESKLGVYMRLYLGVCWDLSFSDCSVGSCGGDTDGLEGSSPVLKRGAGDVVSDLGGNKRMKILGGRVTPMGVGGDATPEHPTIGKPTCCCSFCGLFRRLSMETRCMSLAGVTGGAGVYVQTAVGPRHRAVLQVEALLWIIYSALRRKTFADRSAHMSVGLLYGHSDTGAVRGVVSLVDAVGAWMAALGGALVALSSGVGGSGPVDFYAYAAAVHALGALLQLVETLLVDMKRPHSRVVLLTHVGALVALLLRDQRCFPVVRSLLCGHSSRHSHASGSGSGAGHVHYQFVINDSQGAMMDVLRRAVSYIGAGCEGVASRQGTNSVAEKWGYFGILYSSWSVFCSAMSGDDDGGQSGPGTCGTARLVKLCELLLCSHHYFATLSSSDILRCLGFVGFVGDPAPFVGVPLPPALVLHVCPVLYVLNWAIASGPTGSNTCKSGASELTELLPLVFQLAQRVFSVESSKCSVGDAGGELVVMKVSSADEYETALKHNLGQVAGLFTSTSTSTPPFRDKNSGGSGGVSPLFVSLAQYLLAVIQAICSDSLYSTSYNRNSSNDRAAVLGANPVVPTPIITSFRSSAFVSATAAPSVGVPTLCAGVDSTKPLGVALVALAVLAGVIEQIPCVHGELPAGCEKIHEQSVTMFLKLFNCTLNTVAAKLAATSMSHVGEMSAAISLLKGLLYSVAGDAFALALIPSAPFYFQQITATVLATCQKLRDMSLHSSGAAVDASSGSQVHADNSGGRVSAASRTSATTEDDETTGVRSQASASSATKTKARPKTVVFDSDDEDSEPPGTAGHNVSVSSTSLPTSRRGKPQSGTGYVLKFDEDDSMDVDMGVGVGTSRCDDRSWQGSSARLAFTSDHCYVYATLLSLLLPLPHFPIDDVVGGGSGSLEAGIQLLSRGTGGSGGNITLSAENLLFILYIVADHLLQFSIKLPPLSSRLLMINKEVTADRCVSYQHDLVKTVLSAIMHSAWDTDMGSVGYQYVLKVALTILQVPGSFFCPNEKRSPVVRILTSIVFCTDDAVRKFPVHFWRCRAMQIVCGRALLGMCVSTERNGSSDAEKDSLTDAFAELLLGMIADGDLRVRTIACECTPLLLKLFPKHRGIYSSLLETISAKAAELIEAAGLDPRNADSYTNNHTWLLSTAAELIAQFGSDLQCNRALVRTVVADLVLLLSGTASHYGSKAEVAIVDFKALLSALLDHIAVRLGFAGGRVLMLGSLRHLVSVWIARAFESRYQSYVSRGTIVVPDGAPSQPAFLGNYLEGLVLSPGVVSGSGDLFRDFPFEILGCSSSQSFMTEYGHVILPVLCEPQSREVAELAANGSASLSSSNLKLYSKWRMQWVSRLATVGVVPGACMRYFTAHQLVVLFSYRLYDTVDPGDDSTVDSQRQSESGHVRKLQFQYMKNFIAGAEAEVAPHSGAISGSTHVSDAVLCMFELLTYEPTHNAIMDPLSPFGGADGDGSRCIRLNSGPLAVERSIELMLSSLSKLLLPPTAAAKHGPRSSAAALNTTEASSLLGQTNITLLCAMILKRFREASSKGSEITWLAVVHSVAAVVKNLPLSHSISAFELRVLTDSLTGIISYLCADSGGTSTDAGCTVQMLCSCLSSLGILAGYIQRKIDSFAGADSAVMFDGAEIVPVSTDNAGTGSQRVTEAKMMFRFFTEFLAEMLSLSYAIKVALGIDVRGASARAKGAIDKPENGSVGSSTQDQSGGLYGCYVGSVESTEGLLCIMKRSCAAGYFDKYGRFAASNPGDVDVDENETGGRLKRVIETVQKLCDDMVGRMFESLLDAHSTVDTSTDISECHRATLLVGAVKDCFPLPRCIVDSLDSVRFNNVDIRAALDDKITLQLTISGAGVTINSKGGRSSQLQGDSEGLDGMTAVGALQQPLKHQIYRLMTICKAILLGDSLLLGLLLTHLHSLQAFLRSLLYDMSTLPAVAQRTLGELIAGPAAAGGRGPAAQQLISQLMSSMLGLSNYISSPDLYAFSGAAACRGDTGGLDPLRRCLSDVLGFLGRSLHVECVRHVDLPFHHDQVLSSCNGEIIQLKVLLVKKVYRLLLFSADASQRSGDADVSALAASSLRMFNAHGCLQPLLAVDDRGQISPEDCVLLQTILSFPLLEDPAHEGNPFDVVAFTHNAASNGLSGGMPDGDGVSVLGLHNCWLQSLWETTGKTFLQWITRLSSSLIRHYFTSKTFVSSSSASASTSASSSSVHQPLLPADMFLLSVLPLCSVREDIAACALPIILHTMMFRPTAKLDSGSIGSSAGTVGSGSKLGSGPGSAAWLGSQFQPLIYNSNIGDILSEKIASYVLSPQNNPMSSAAGPQSTAYMCNLVLFLGRLNLFEFTETCKLNQRKLANGLVISKPKGRMQKTSSKSSVNHELSGHATAASASTDYSVISGNNNWKLAYDYYLSIDCSYVIKACVRCNHVCTALQLIEVLSEQARHSHSHNPNDPDLFFYPSGICLSLDQEATDLLLTVYGQMHDPDAIYGVNSSNVQLQQQIQLYTHTGQHLAALTAHESLLKSQSLTTTMGVSQSLRADIVDALGALGCGQVVQMLLGGSGSGSGSGSGLPDVHSAVCGAAADGRLRQWDQSVAVTGAPVTAYVDTVVSAALSNISYENNRYFVQQLESSITDLMVPRIVDLFPEETGRNILKELNFLHDLVETRVISDAVAPVSKLSAVALSDACSGVSSGNSSGNANRAAAFIGPLMRGIIQNTWRQQLKYELKELSAANQRSINHRIDMLRSLLAANYIDSSHVIAFATQLQAHMPSGSTGAAAAHAYSPLMYKLKDLIFQQVADSKESAVMLRQSQWTLQECKLVWKRGLGTAACSMLDQNISNINAQRFVNHSFFETSEEGRDLLSECCRTAGEWRIQSHTATSSIISSQFFKPAIEFATSSAQKISVYYTVASFNAKLHGSMKAKINSFEWKQSVRVAEDRKAELDKSLKLYEAQRAEYNAAANGRNPGPGLAEMKEEVTKLHRHVSWLRRECDMDAAERAAVESSKDRYMISALKQFGNVLALSQNADSDSIFQAVNIWFNNVESVQVHEIMKKIIHNTASSKFIPLTYQVFSRLGSASTSTEGVNTLVFKLCLEHPHHTLPQLFALVNEDKEPSVKVATPRTNAAELVLSKLRQHDKRLLNLVTAVSLLLRSYIKLANTSVSKYKGVKSTNISFRELQGRDGFQDVLANIAAASNVQPCVLTSTPTLLSSAHHALRQSSASSYQHFSTHYSVCPSVVKIVRFNDRFSITESGITQPKIVDCLGSDGVFYKQLVKGGDDTRQDAVMQQVFENLNATLLRDDETRKRNLNIRTYKIVPTTPQSGVIEWVENTMPVGGYLCDKSASSRGADFEVTPPVLGAHSRYYPNDWTHAQCRDRLRNAKDDDEKLEFFKEACSKFHPAFRFFFLEKFGTPSAWFTSRQAYTRSVACTSIIGYILGIGDRHSQNILIDVITAEVVHIDFGIVFEQGKVLGIPETVPCRLTRDMIDGMGVTGCRGVFMRCCAEVLRVLRAHSLQLLTILEVVIYDPLYKWSLSPQAKSRQTAEAGAEGYQPQAPVGGKRSRAAAAKAPEPLPVETEDGDSSFDRDAAERTIMRIRNKLQGLEDSASDAFSIEGQIEYIVNEAQDLTHLSKIFCGWAPWL